MVGDVRERRERERGRRESWPRDKKGGKERGRWREEENLGGRHVINLMNTKKYRSEG